MLRITADVFSGRPNPAWDVDDDSETRAALQEIAGDRALLLDAEPPDGELGLRGFRIEALSDELAQEFGLGPGAYLPVGAQARGGNSASIAERLIYLSSRGRPPAGAADDVPALDEALESFLTTQLEQTVRAASVTDGAAPSADEAEAEAEDGPSAAVTCMIELGAFNPGFWNNDPNVRANNNCYNYASNWRTNTFAQPGRGCGRMYTAITCAEVSRGALCDGMHRRFNCFPDTEKPRYLVAMVVAPGPGFVDYHWYRKQKEGFWGHKPGGTAARKTDNSGAVILNPETCNRGPYTIFCGYFYGCATQQRRIR